MYQSKNEGRNKITVFNASVVAAEPQTGMADDLAVFQHLEHRLKNINLRNEASVLESMMPMVREVDKREGYSHGHTERLVKNVETVAKGLGLSEREVLDVTRAALLSNLGLLKVPEQVLASRQPLTEDQRRLIREHPVRTVEIIRDIAFLEPVAREILYHHERYDGAGYPVGLKGEDIPLGTRIISVVETFEALTCPRPYREHIFPKEEALEIIRQESGKQFDPVVVEQFLARVA